MSARVLPRRRVFGAAACLVSLGGCSLVFPTPAPQLYRLAPRMNELPDATRASGQLIVDTPVASQSLDTERIALTRNRTTLDYFAGAAWTDRAPRLLQGLMIDAFQDSGQITAVGRDSSNLNADYQLETVLREFQARYAASDLSPPTVVVSVDVQLLSMTNRRVTGHIRVAKEVPAAQNSLDSIVDAFDAAVGEVIGDIVRWALPSMAHVR